MKRKNHVFAATFSFNDKVTEQEALKALTKFFKTADTHIHVSAPAPVSCRISRVE